MRVTLAPVIAVIDKWSAGMREVAIDVVSGLLSQFMAIESHFVSAASTDQAIAALDKTDSDPDPDPDPDPGPGPGPGPDPDQVESAPTTSCVTA